MLRSVYPCYHWHSKDCGDWRVDESGAGAERSQRVAGGEAEWGKNMESAVSSAALRCAVARALAAGVARPAAERRSATFVAAGKAHLPCACSRGSEWRFLGSRNPLWQALSVRRATRLLSKLFVKGTLKAAHLRDSLFPDLVAWRRRKAVASWGRSLASLGLLLRSKAAPDGAVKVAECTGALSPAKRMPPLSSAERLPAGAAWLSAAKRSAPGAAPASSSARPHGIAHPAHC